MRGAHGQSLRDYHEHTKHTPRSVREAAHFLDWKNEPARFKRYVGLRPEGLPPVRSTGMPSHEAVWASRRPEGSRPLDLEVLSHLLFQAAGINRTIRSQYGEFHFRTYACAGALYPVEVYVVAREVEGLEAGVYQYAPLEHGLTALRREVAGVDVGLAGASPGQATLLLTGIPWRTAWKYTARGFRHLYWDAGMMLANLLAACATQEVTARLHVGFVDGAANHAIGVDGETEFALCAVALGRDTATAATELPPLSLETEPLSPRPRRDEVVEAAHRALELPDDQSVRAFREGAMAAQPEWDEQLFPAVTPMATDALSRDPLEDVIRRRGSSRALARDPYPATEAAAILDRALAGVPGDWSSGQGVVEPIVMSAALEGIPPGVHAYAPGGRFRLRKEGLFRQEAGYLCLEQRLGADAAAVTILGVRLDAVLDRLGNRGYAAAQLEAGIVGGRIYLGAYAQCLGASGITFYDDDVRRFCETELEPMLLVVTGAEARRASIRACREEREAGSRAERPVQ